MMHAACADKVRHARAGPAFREARRMAHYYRTPFIAYRCQHCGGWHVGETDRLPHPDIRKRPRRHLWMT